MRTTVNIDDYLLSEARQFAAAHHKTLGELVNDALRALMGRDKSKSARGKIALPTYGGSGLQPRVDLENKELLSEILGDNNPPHVAP